MAIEKIWFGFLCIYIYFVAVSRHVHVIVTKWCLPFLVCGSFREINIHTSYIQISSVLKAFGCNAPFHFQLWSGCYCSNQTDLFTHTHTYNVQDQRNHEFNGSLQNTVNARNKKRSRRNEIFEHKTMVPMKYC